MSPAINDSNADLQVHFSLIGTHKIVKRREEKSSLRTRAGKCYHIKVMNIFFFAGSGGVADRQIAESRDDDAPVIEG